MYASQFFFTMDDPSPYDSFLSLQVLPVSNLINDKARKPHSWLLDLFPSRVSFRTNSVAGHSDDSRRSLARLIMPPQKDME